MGKTKNHPEQLHLDLQWEYLSRAMEFSESLSYFEAASRTLLKPQANPPVPSPLWDEIAGSRY